MSPSMGITGLDAGKRLRSRGRDGIHYPGGTSPRNTLANMAVKEPGNRCSIKRGESNAKAVSPPVKTVEYQFGP